MNRTAVQTQPHHDKDLVPRRMIGAMTVLVLVVLALVTVARLTGQPLISTPPEGAISAQRMIVLSGDMSGAVQVRDETGAIIADLEPEQGGFISGVHRVIIHERNKHGVAIDGPVLLLRRDSGRLEIQDPSTGWRADLMGFGADNARAFARLLAQ